MNRKATGEKGVEAAWNTPTGKVFALLQTLASNDGAMSLSELATSLGLAKTTVHRMVVQLQDLGYLQREPGSRKLSVAPALCRLGVDLIESAFRLAPRHEVLRALAEDIGESCSIGVRMGYEVSYIDDVAANAPLAVHFRAGRRAPLHCTSIGKLYLGKMSDVEWRRYLSSDPLRAYTERTITDPARLREETRRVAREGFAATQEEFVLGVVGAAVLVTGPGSRVYAGVAFHAPAVRLTHEGAKLLRPHLERAAARLVATFEP